MQVWRQTCFTSGSLNFLLSSTFSDTRNTLFKVLKLPVCCLQTLVPGMAINSLWWSQSIKSLDCWHQLVPRTCRSITLYSSHYEAGQWSASVDIAGFAHREVFSVNMFIPTAVSFQESERKQNWIILAEHDPYTINISDGFFMIQGSKIKVTEPISHQGSYGPRANHSPSENNLQSMICFSQCTEHLLGNRWSGSRQSGDVQFKTRGMKS